MSLSKKTIDGLRAGVARVKKEPLRLDMCDWGWRTTNPRSKTDMRSLADRIQCDDEAVPPPCGTVGCLAGNILIALTPKRKLKSLFQGVSWDEHVQALPHNTPEIVCKKLSLTPTQEQGLFYTSGWPWKYRAAYYAAANQPTAQKRAKARYQALKGAVESFIKAGGDVELWRERGAE